MLRRPMATLLPHVVVTGASRGIGRAVALRFARQGYPVWALARSAGDLESLRAEAPDRVRPLVVDGADEAALRAACKTITAEGPPGVLVNNAGIAPSAPLVRTPMADFDRTMAINVRAPFVMCQELVPGMEARKLGRIINMASTAGLRGFRYTSAYSASKHALVGLTKSLALELAQSGVTVNAVCPGWVDTDMVATAAARIQKVTGRTGEEARAALWKMHPIGRFVQPEEVAEVCFFLASEQAAAITGTTYVIDGGELA
jgi:NAD(P)-dependent dehydrogenase (short-subunit alcohol dehydrogenase family)